MLINILKVLTCLCAAGFSLAMLAFVTFCAITEPNPTPAFWVAVALVGMYAGIGAVGCGFGAVVCSKVSR